ncbi:MAG: UDP-2,3-diacylglucosamine hydrolase [Candidatus Marinimicrobia bacterium]|nr:UDP-2,3-diacylglucosamine hydrolase [Candidatus Neomarinimicrobiota bacterium]|tara:strand:+ start:3943 stop:4692 length:750 start_codon:yes stop_codon:yes gene_type:complete
MNIPLYFISDVHLSLESSSNEENKRKKLKQFIRHVIENNGTLVIVGDLFDFWFEYKYVIPKAYFDILKILNEAKLKGLIIHFVPGNHDFWIKEFLKENLFHQVHPQGIKINISGKNFLISHGDGILSWDRGYRFLRNFLRNRVFVYLYNWIHPDLGYAIAKKFSRNGNYNHHTTEYKEKVLHELKNYSENEFNNGIDYIIMGHYHQLKEINLKNGKLIILGDWIRHYSYGYFDGKELSLKIWGVNNDDV